MMNANDETAKTAAPTPPPEPISKDGIEAELEQAALDELRAIDKLIPMKPLSEFKRDLEKKNVLIDGRWLTRGGTAMIISTTGSGKSILQTQMALCFNRGIDCCGLHPVRPFRSWVVQSEDDEDRVSIDRNDVVEYLRYQHPVDDKGNPIDWDEAFAQTMFLDFTYIKKGADFLRGLDAKMRFHTPPDVVFINPFNAYFGGDLKSGADVSAFFKGGTIRGGNETEGLEAILKRHNVGTIIFSHTGKPPTVKERKAWLTDEFPEYKMCGASEISDAIRSAMSILPCTKHKGVFIFTAGKNGSQLGWKDAAGKSFNRALYKWGDHGKHYWQDVPKEDWEKCFADAGITNEDDAPTVAPPPPPPDMVPIALRVFAGLNELVPMGKAAEKVREAVNQELLKYADEYRLGNKVKTLAEKSALAFIKKLNEEGKIKILPKGANGTKGIMCGLPPMVDAFLKSKLLDVKPTPADDGKPTPSFDNPDAAPQYGRSHKFGKQKGGML